MNSSDVLIPSFSKVYVEEAIAESPETIAILSKLPKAKIIKIRHYKDVFNRKYQDPRIQKLSKQLILASQTGNMIFPGAPVCQSFGEEHFYYASLVMGCLFSCDYCFLQGMYPTANVVVFVNIEDYFREIDLLLEKNPVYLCISYDTDLMALEHLTGYVKQFMDFASERPDLTVEVRTKASVSGFFNTNNPSDNVVFAFTLSPLSVASACEHGAGSLDARLSSIKAAIDNGFPVRLCFDPMLYVPGWRDAYRDLCDTVRASIPMEKLRDVSIGTFRISQDFLKSIRKQHPDSAIIQYPFENRDGYYSYSAFRNREMVGFLLSEIKKDLPEGKIFLWE